MNFFLSYFLLCQFCQFVQIRLFLFSQPHRYFYLIITYFLPYYYLFRIFLLPFSIFVFLSYCSNCTIFRFSSGDGPVMVLFYIAFLHVLACSFSIQACSFNHTDIHKKARHEISLMSGKIEICVRRLEDYHALRHNTVNINNLAFDFIYNRHLLAERDGSHYFSILDR